MLFSRTCAIAATRCIAKTSKLMMTAQAGRSSWLACSSRKSELAVPRWPGLISITCASTGAVSPVRVAPPSRRADCAPANAMAPTYQPRRAADRHCRAQHVEEERRPRAQVVARRYELSEGELRNVERGG